ncbi:hypothetical protein PSET11_00011 [Arthrobacter ulcerisalmonis]|uniref:Uncharacterized protein n=1 Tax=Arthrobacter ulcerisalmonis TaxID=2483813 RepID=A0A3P5WEN1_9MICC|nr:hypothetical protein PSET11_00011 [Arthrobacter ulcerisalmonis]
MPPIKPTLRPATAASSRMGQERSLPASRGQRTLVTRSACVTRGAPSSSVSHSELVSDSSTPAHFESRPKCLMWSRLADATESGWPPPRRAARAMMSRTASSAVARCTGAPPRLIGTGNGGSAAGCGRGAGANWCAGLAKSEVGRPVDFLVRPGSSAGAEDISWLQGHGAPEQRPGWGLHSPSSPGAKGRRLL